MFKRVLLGCVLAVGLISGAAAQTISTYSASGPYLRSLSNPGDLNGGPFAGDTIAQLFSLPGVQVGLNIISNLFVLSSSGASEYNGNTGVFSTTYDPTLSGGLYGGQTLGQAFTAGLDIDLANMSFNTPTVDIFGSNGLYQYNATTGTLDASYDTTLSGGLYNGLTIGQIFSAGGVTMNAETSSTLNGLTIISSSGMSIYSFSSGAFVSSENPTLTGGTLNGLTLGQAYSEGRFVDPIGNAGEVALISPLPEPPTWMLMLVGGAMLVGMCWFRRRPTCPT